MQQKRIYLPCQRALYNFLLSGESTPGNLEVNQGQRKSFQGGAKCCVNVCTCQEGKIISIHTGIQFRDGDSRLWAYN